MYDAGLEVLVDIANGLVVRKAQPSEIRVLVLDVLYIKATVANRLISIHQVDIHPFYLTHSVIRQVQILIEALVPHIQVASRDLRLFSIEF